MLADCTAMMCLLHPPTPISISISILILNLVMMMTMMIVAVLEDLPERGNHVEEGCAISKAVNYQTHHSMSPPIRLRSALRGIRLSG